MASSQTKYRYGYEDGRFEKDVDENFHCSICYNVLKEPRMCRNNEHVFCLACITQHLKVNHKTCPECKERLSLDTLRRPRVLNNYLSKLKINCDYASRGCREFICVEDLEAHVANCGFVPVLCSNKNCGMEINKQERFLHENAACEYRKLKYYDCGQIQEDVRTLKGSVVDLERKVEVSNEKTQNNHTEMKTIVAKLEGRLTELDGKVELMNRRHYEIKHEVQNEVKDIRNEVKDVKENLSKVNKDMGEIKDMMRQLSDKLSMLELPNKLPSLAAGPFNEQKEDILIAGGAESPKRYLRSTEIFSWEKNCWVKVSPMNEAHSGASSYIHTDNLFVIGGESSKTIETLDLHVSPLKWTNVPAELPYGFDDHQTVVYQQQVIHVGGYNYDKGLSNVISEVQFTSPKCTLKQLCQMPEARERHRAEIFENKVLILGGTDDCAETMGNVLEFDAKRKKCKEMPPLPHPLTQMATVRWRDEVVVLGGCDKCNQVLRDVFMYDRKTGKTTALPSMLEKRYACCAVITGNTLVVMGGMNEEKRALNSVECFVIGGSAWKYLPAMNEARFKAVAEVLPSTRKYV